MSSTEMWEQSISRRSVNVRALTHHDPTSALAKQFGDEVVRAEKAVAHLEDVLRQLDRVTEQLAALPNPVTVDVDLGEVGNAARSARKVQAMANPRRTFSFPA
jgi:hypothetical protein